MDGDSSSAEPEHPKPANRPPPTTTTQEESSLVKPMESLKLVPTKRPPRPKRRSSSVDKSIKSSGSDNVSPPKLHRWHSTGEDIENSKSQEDEYVPLTESADTFDDCEEGSGEMVILTDSEDELYVEDDYETVFDTKRLPDDKEEASSTAEDNEAKIPASPPRSGNYETPSNSPPGSPPSSPKPSSPPDNKQRRSVSGNKRFSFPLSPKRNKDASLTSEYHTTAGPSPIPELLSPVSSGKIKKKRSRPAASEGLTLTPLRTIRNLAMGKGSQHSNKGLDTPDLDSDGEDQNEADDDSSSSSDSSYGDDMSESSNEIIFDNAEIEGLDFETMETYPVSFLDVPPESYDYLDPELLKNISAQNSERYALEHHLMIRALLQLLAERDHIGVEGNIKDKSNIMKKGPLKKKSKNHWSTKYIEIRKGNLTYYGDKTKGKKRKGGNKQTLVHLRRRTCKCVEAPKESSSGAFVFEIHIEGRPKLSWMAQSEEERQGWVRAITQAMISEVDVDNFDNPLNLHMYKNALDHYQSIQSSFQEATSKAAYLVAISSLLRRQRTGAELLQVPLHWIREQISDEEDTNLDENAPQKRVRSTIVDFWKTLRESHIAINGSLVEGGSPLSGERVIGALSRCILEFDKCEEYSENEQMEDRGMVLKRLDSKSLMSELESVSYARSILMSILHSKSRRDPQKTLQNLVLNEDIVSIENISSNPLHIDVSFAGDDFIEYEPKSDDITSWIETRAKKHKKFKERFFVLSEGVLSHYTMADPRPRGLRGQLVIKGAEISILEDETIHIHTKEEDRLLRFSNRSEFLKWKIAIERCTKSELVPDVKSPNSESTAEQTAANKRHRRKSSDILRSGVKPIKHVATSAAGAGVKVIKGAKNAGVKSIKGAKNAGVKSIKGAKNRIARGIRGGLSRDESSARRKAKLDMLVTSTRNLASSDDLSDSEPSDPTVQVVVEMTNIYAVKTVGDDQSEGPLW